MTRWVLLAAGGCALAMAPIAPAQESAPEWTPAQQQVLDALPVPQRERIASHADGAAILAGTQPLFEWRLHPPPKDHPDHPLGGVAFTDSGRNLAAVGVDGTGKRFTVATGAEDGPLTIDHVGAHATAWGKYGKNYATGGPDGRVHLWKGNGRKWRRFDASDDALYSVAMHPSGKLVACCGLDGRAKVFDTSGRERFDFAGYGFGLHSCAFTPDGRALITGGRSEFVEWWDVQKDTPVRQAKLAPETMENGEDFVTWSVAPSPDSGGFAAAGADGKVRVHDWSDGKAEWAFPAHPGGALCVAWHPSAGVIASGGRGGELRFWTAKDGTTLRTVKVDPLALYGLAFSPKAPLLATVGSDGTARCWVVPELLAR